MYLLVFILSFLFLFLKVVSFMKNIYFVDTKFQPFTTYKVGLSFWLSKSK